MIRRTTLEGSPRTLCWRGDRLVDWARGGQEYLLDGSESQRTCRSFAFSFDSVIMHETKDASYAFLYKKIGTKGLLLKDGEEIREINRSYYQAELYEYPAAFLQTPDGELYLAHCPAAYNQIDFEHVETGRIVTAAPDRKPEDIFHSRLLASPGGKRLASRGWVWHPADTVEVFDAAACLENPRLLDGFKYPPIAQSDLNAADFPDDDHFLVSASEDEDIFS